jgi:WD40 repeat protein
VAGWASILDAASGRELLSLQSGGVNAIAKMAFHPSEPVLVIGTVDGAILLWDLRHAELIGEPLRRASALSSLAVSPDGKTIAAGYADGAAVFWSLDFDQWRSLACAVANRALTDDEWRRFVGPSPPRPYCTTPD